MAANKIVNIEPIALTTTLTTNLINCGVTSMSGPIGLTIGQPYLILKHIRITNKTGAAVTCSFWKGASTANAAGTEIIGTGLSIAANSSYDYTGVLRLDSGDFLVGGASAATALTLTAEGEIGISG